MEKNTRNGYISPSNKYLLSIPEASLYFGIGAKKIRKIIADNKHLNISLRNGSNILVKREKFESFLDEAEEI